tara:strand:+ start:719 stop:1204 length:486 start_codon:yes stop_codon:yes gene_type:complete
MDTLPLHHTKWSDRLAFDIALMLEGSGESLEEVQARHNVTADAIIDFNKDKVFLKKVESYRNEIKEKGMTFKLKARAQAEELLTTSWTLIHSPETSSAVKADLIKSTVKWGGLEAKSHNMEESSGGVKITINLGGQEHTTRVVNSEESPDEHELIETERAL